MNSININIIPKQNREEIIVLPDWSSSKRSVLSSNLIPYTGWFCTHYDGYYYLGWCHKTLEYFNIHEENVHYLYKIEGLLYRPVKDGPYWILELM